jgi:UDP-glucose 4-epimerase
LAIVSGTHAAVLVTGALGNVGTSAVTTLLASGHRVTTLDLDTPANRRKARRLRHHDLGHVWGDVTDRHVVQSALEGVAAVVHLAAMIPPRSDRAPGAAARVNVEGTRTVVEAIVATGRPIRMVHASSLSVYGRTQHMTPPRRVDDPINPSDHYGRTKRDAEQIVRTAEIDWVVLRLGAVLPLRLPVLIDPIMFEVPLSDRIEFVHALDVGTAITHAVERAQVSRLVLNVGGGSDCRLHQRDVIRRPLERLGVGMLPDRAFTSVPFHTDWLDTDDSQRLLNYQHRSFDDYVTEVGRRYRWRRPFVKVLSPVIRRTMLRRSPYWRQLGGRRLS